MPPSDDRGQMMLLTAFVLVIGFVVLSSMVARVNQLPEETRQSVDRPIYTESEAVARGVKVMMDRIYEISKPADDSNPDYPKELEGHFQAGARHFERLESARGFRLNFIEEPTCLPGTTSYQAKYALSDVQTRIEFTTVYPPGGGNLPAPPPVDPTNPVPYNLC